MKTYKQNTLHLKLLPEGGTTVIKKAGYPNLGKSSNSDHLLTIDVIYFCPVLLVGNAP